MKVKSKSKTAKVAKTVEKVEVNEEEEIAIIQKRLQEETPESGTQIARYDYILFILQIIATNLFSIFNYLVMVSFDLTPSLSALPHFKVSLWRT